MSRLWRNELRIGLCPDRLILAGLKRDLREKHAEKDIVPISREASGWRAAVEALPSAMARFDSHKLEVTVIISNHFVRYALLPWNAELRTEAEWESFARHRLAGVYGPSVEGWALQNSKTASEGPRVVCAADRPMLEALSEAVCGSGASLVSVQPYLMAAFNRVRRRIGKESCWLVLEERGRLTMALFHQGTWQSIRSRRLDGDWQAELVEVLEREQAMMGLREACTQALVWSEDEIESWSAGPYCFVDLTLEDKAGDRAFAMAMG